MAFDTRSTDLRVINALTAYPSIPTYHTLDPTTGWLDETPTEFSDRVIGTEKIGGANARIISLPDGYYLLAGRVPGGQDKLLYAKGDLVGDSALGIVGALRPVAHVLAPPVHDVIRVHHLVVYGGRITPASRQYTGEQAVGFRLLDIAVLADYPTMLDRPLAEIINWREAGGQRFLREDELAATAAVDGLELAPRLFTVNAMELPLGIDKTCQFLADQLPRTRCALDHGARGQAEGIVLRTPDRGRVAMARFRDYDRTLRRRPGSQPRC